MTTALIIDDNEMNLETLNLVLKKEGVSVVTLTSPAHLEAFIAKQSAFDVVFLDIEFPNYNGIDLIHHLRQMPKLANVPIIAYSVNINEVENARDAGFDGFIGKPINIAKFPAQLRGILAGKAVWELG